MEKLIQKLQKNKFDTTVLSNGGITIQPTQRNKLKTEAVEVFKNILKNALTDDVNVELTNDGICISIYNEALNNEISFIINPVIKNLDYDAEFEAEEYQRLTAEKTKEKKMKEEKKQKKIAEDARIRKETLLLREKREKGEA